MRQYISINVKFGLLQYAVHPLCHAEIALIGWLQEAQSTTFGQNCGFAPRRGKGGSTRPRSMAPHYLAPVSHTKRCIHKIFVSHKRPLATKNSWKINRNNNFFCVWGAINLNVWPNYWTPKIVVLEAPLHRCNIYRSRWNLAWYNIPWVHFPMPNLALIGKGWIQELPNLKILFKNHGFTITFSARQIKVWHGKAHHTTRKMSNGWWRSDGAPKS